MLNSIIDIVNSIGEGRPTSVKDAVRYNNHLYLIHREKDQMMVLRTHVFDNEFDILTLISCKHFNNTVIAQLIDFTIRMDCD